MTQRAIDKVRENARIAKGNMLRVDPPGFGFPVYLTPLDGTDNDALVTPDGVELSPSQQDARLVVRKALDKDGQRLFTAGDEHYLATEALRSDLKLIIGALFAAVPSLAQARSAVEADPTSAPSSGLPTP